MSYMYNDMLDFAFHLPLCALLLQLRASRHPSVNISSAPAVRPYSCSLLIDPRQLQLPSVLRELRFGDVVHRVEVPALLVCIHSRSPAFRRGGTFPYATIFSLKCLLPDLFDGLRKFCDKLLAVGPQRSRLSAVLIRELKEMREESGDIGCRPDRHGA